MSVNSLPAETDASDSENPFVGSSELANAGHETKDQGGLARLASLGSLALLDQVVVSATNFATTFLLAKLCSQSEMGLSLIHI